MKVKRIISALLCLLLTALTLASCSSNRGEVVMEYEGIKLYENMYNYWISTFKRNIMNNYSDAKDADFWTKEYSDGVTVEDYFTDIVNKQIMYYLICQKFAKDNKVSVPKDTVDEINNDISEKIDYAGGRGEMNSELSVFGLNIDGLKQCYLWQALYEAVDDYFYGDNGTEKVTADQIVKYYEENYSHIQYIVFYTTKLITDDDGNYVYDTDGKPKMEEMTKEETEEIKKKIEECYEKCKNGEDFIELMKKYSDQPTDEKYPNGFFVSLSEADVWGSEIATKALAANVGDVFRVDEEYCTFIVKKEELTEFSKLTTTDTNQISDIEHNLASDLLREKLDKCIENVTVNKDITAKYKLSTVQSNPYYAY